MHNPVVIGVFGKTSGVRGWIRFHSYTTPKKDIFEFSHFFVNKNELNKTAEKVFYNDLKEIFFKDKKIHFGNIIVKLSEYNSAKEASCLVNSKIFVLSEQLPDLEEGEYYWSDLIGCEVINSNGIFFGKVTEIMATGANDVLVVNGEGGRRLVPYISEVIQRVDLKNKVICVYWDFNF